MISDTEDYLTLDCDRHATPIGPPPLDRQPQRAAPDLA